MSKCLVILVGNLGQDPELRHTANGTAVANLSIATNESWKDKQGNKQEHTEWHHVVVWGPRAEACQKYLAKGRQVLVTGKLRTRSWEKDGITRYRTEIMAADVQFLGGAKKQETFSANEDPGIGDVDLGALAGLDLADMGL